MIPDTHLDILDSTALAHVATIGPAGEPHNTPVWFAWDGVHVRLSLTTDRQKYRNLQRDDRIAVSLTAVDNPMHSLEIRGTVVIEPDTDRSFIDGLANKYLGVPAYPLPEPDATRVIVTVEPQRVTTFL